MLEVTRTSIIMLIWRNYAQRYEYIDKHDLPNMDMKMNRNSKKKRKRKRLTFEINSGRRNLKDHKGIGIEI